MRPRVLSLILLVMSLALTIIFWIVGLPFFLLFLFIPVLPFISGRRKTRRCPVCIWETTGSERFCPYDATPLENPEHAERRETR